VNLKRLAALRDVLIFGIHQKRRHPADVFLPRLGQPLALFQAPGSVCLLRRAPASSAWR
jgi:hypothetical protein